MLQYFFQKIMPNNIYPKWKLSIKFLDNGLFVFIGLASSTLYPTFFMPSGRES